MARPEYIADRSSRHGTHSEAAHRRSSRLRTAYFVTASLWGVLVGIGGLAAAQNLFGRPVRFNLGVAAALLPTFLLAAVGGAVAAAAYREARNRARR